MSRELTPSERARLDELYRQALERGRRQAEEGPGRIVLVVPLPRPEEETPIRATPAGGGGASGEARGSQ